jgi:hypothetical protein
VDSVIFFPSTKVEVNYEMKKFNQEEIKVLPRKKKIA